ncbi:MAG TPA: hypothetical protein PLQ29_09070, partial [Spirochaetales bacterium]|nr:hypothetical protein [Spirochaetales bacterium]
ILTSRPDQAVLRRLRSAIGELEEKSVPALSRTDVRAIVERRAGRAVDASIVDRIAETTAGLPLLVRHAGSMLARATAPGEGDELSELPATLSAFGAESYRAIRGPGDDADVRGRLFQLLGLAREPIGAAALHDLLQLDGEAVTLEQCREHLESMSSFLVEARVGLAAGWLEHGQVACVVELAPRHAYEGEAVRQAARAVEPEEGRRYAPGRQVAGAADHGHNRAARPIVMH